MWLSRNSLKKKKKISCLISFKSSLPSLKLQFPKTLLQTRSLHSYSPVYSITQPISLGAGYLKDSSLLACPRLNSKHPVQARSSSNTLNQQIFLLPVPLANLTSSLIPLFSLLPILTPLQTSFILTPKISESVTRSSPPLSYSSIGPPFLTISIFHLVSLLILWLPSPHLTHQPQ